MRCSFFTLGWVAAKTNGSAPDNLTDTQKGWWDDGYTAFLAVPVEKRKYEVYENVQ